MPTPSQKDYSIALGASARAAAQIASVDANDKAKVDATRAGLVAEKAAADAVIAAYTP